MGGFCQIYKQRNARRDLGSRQNKIDTKCTLHAYKDFPEYKIIQNVPYKAFKLAPSVYLTMEGNILFRKANGAWGNYPYKGFGYSAQFPSIVPNDRIDKFVKDVLESAMQRLSLWHPMLKFIQEKISAEEIKK